RTQAQFREARQVLVRRVQHPLEGVERGGQHVQAARRYRVHQGRAGAFAAQLHQVGAAPVAVAGGALGVDGDGAAAAGKPPRVVGHLVGRGEQRRTAVTGGRQRDGFRGGGFGT